MCIEITASIRLIQLDVFTYAGEKMFFYDKDNDGLIRLRSVNLRSPYYYCFKNGWAEPANQMQAVLFQIETQHSQIFLQTRYKLGFHISGISPLDISGSISKFNERIKNYQETLEIGWGRDLLIIPVIFKEQDVQMVGNDDVVVNTFGIPSRGTFLQIYRLAYDYTKESVRKAIDETADIYSKLYPKFVKDE